MVPVAVAVEIAGNLAAAAVLIVGLVRARTRPTLRLIKSLRATALALAAFALTNVFYGVAYFGRRYNAFDLWDTTVEIELIRPLQVSTTYIVPAALLAVTARVLTLSKGGR